MTGLTEIKYRAYLKGQVQWWTNLALRTTRADLRKSYRERVAEWSAELRRWDEDMEAMG